MNVDELQRILGKHRKWVNDEPDGEQANLQDANLQDAKLQYAKLQYANLQYANLQDANLQDANLQYANLQDANLRGANLQYANLQGAKLQGAKLQYANLVYWQCYNWTWVLSETHIHAGCIRVERTNEGMATLWEKVPAYVDRQKMEAVIEALGGFVLIEEAIA